MSWLTATATTLRKVNGTARIAGVVEKFEGMLKELEVGMRECEEEIKRNDEDLRVEEERFRAFKAAKVGMNVTLGGNIQLAKNVAAGIKKVLGGEQ